MSSSYCSLVGHVNTSGFIELSVGFAIVIESKNRSAIIAEAYPNFLDFKSNE